MTEAEWLSATDPHAMMAVPTSDLRRLRLFAVACCRRHISLMDDSRCPEAIDAAERYADGNQPLHTLIECRKKVNKLRLKLNDEGGVRRALAAATWWVSYEYREERLVRDMVSHVALWMRSVGESGEREAQCALLHDIFRNPFRPVGFQPAWRTEHTVGIASKMYDDREFAAMPILADALEEAGCDNADILSHCREPGVHVRGCWVVDLVMGK